MHVTWPVKVLPDSPFPVTNIPFGIFSTQDSVRALSEGILLVILY
jgi:hypothetical protein